ncbi:hypothetical protein CK203_021673 [Vitis vinifera]|uniref:Bulb-type lectin domain-containing protein n=1 Tax=Vitis vinifera TaxID=29760 RepID=A0A438J4Q1_VITVI|nr:hypothetical protein CK203_021673 [Vitis vinifera]
MATTRSESLFVGVGSQQGETVGENATLTFGTDGNLVLAHADGRVAWQTALPTRAWWGSDCFQLETWCFMTQKGSLTNVTLTCSPDTDEGYAYNLILDYYAPFPKPQWEPHLGGLASLGSDLHFFDRDSVRKPSANCRALSGCGVNDFHYYKLEGVDHFMNKYSNGDGPMKEKQCSDKCSKDCC